MRPRLVLHIGTAKTGTTALQRALSASRDALVAAGCYYPESAGNENHFELAIHAAVLAKMEKNRQAEPPPSRATFQAAFADEIAALPPNVHTVIMSNEHCQTRLKTAAQISALHDFLAPYFSGITVSLYIRRQDRRAVSAYSTRLKSLLQPDLIPRDVDSESPLYNYYNSVTQWAAVFGRDAIQIGIYDRKELFHNDITLDFLNRIGCGSIRLADIQADENQSLGLKAQSFLAGYNTKFDNADEDPGQQLDRRSTRIRKRLLARLAPLDTGAGRLPARRDAEVFCAMFADSNAKLLAEFLPGRTSLFDSDFSAYPLEEVPYDPAMFAVGEAFAELSRHSDKAAAIGDIARLRKKGGINRGGKNRRGLTD